MAMIARLMDAVSPGVGAVVMASGVVSLCFSTMRMLWLSRPLSAVAALTWIVLVVVHVTRLFTDRARCFDEVRCPAALTLVAIAFFHEDLLWRLGQALSWVALAAWVIVAVGSRRRAWNISAR